MRAVGIGMATLCIKIYAYVWNTETQNAKPFVFKYK